MSTEVAVALVGFFGTVVTAASGVMVAMLTRLNRKVGEPNGTGSLAGELADLRSLLVAHIAEDDRRFRRLERAFPG